ncbi:MAG: 6-carboxytetrahydropterin synthase QueD [Lachnospirales bacterium]
MYSLKTEHSFDSAHFLSGYNGKCANIHGHRWKVIIEVMSESVKDSGQIRGMIVDFSTLKSDLKKEVDFFDHSLIIEENTLKENTYNALIEEGFNIISVKFRPTAENFAKYFYDRFKSLGYNVKEAVVYETPNNCAAYSEV